MLAAGLAGGQPPLSTLDTSGEDARAIAGVFWWMASGAAVVWLIAVGVLLYCLAGHRRIARTQARRIVVAGGVVTPLVLLAVLVGTVLPGVSRLVDGAPPPAAFVVRVAGERWWWRVSYPLSDGRRVDLANELYLPLGRTTHLELSSDNVIHSFWIPSLAGKVDMVPGRTTHLTLEPTRAAAVRGVCAEYCGASHARMAFDAFVVEAAEFDRWLQAESRQAASPESAAARDGAAVFAASGCGACHTVRGTGAAGTIGPDLTHVGRRRRLAAATLSNDDDQREHWLERPDAVKPGALMPGFAALGAPRLTALSAYLRELR
jgi:cytochrome c oxidase subunit 2